MKDVFVIVRVIEFGDFLEIISASILLLRIGDITKIYVVVNVE